MSLRCLVLVMALLSCCVTADEQLSEPAPLFQPSRETTLLLNPAGDTLALIVRTDGQNQVLETLNISSGVRRQWFTTASLDGEDAAITRLAWVDNDSLLVQVYELTDGVARLADTRNVAHVFVVHMNEGAEAAPRYFQTTGAIVSTLPTEADNILFAVAGSTSLVYRIDTTKLNRWGQRRGKTTKRDGGQFTRNRRVAEVEGVALRWVAGPAGDVRGVLAVRADESVVFLLRDDNAAQWREVRAWNKPKPRKSLFARRNRAEKEVADDDDSESELVPVALAGQGDDFYALLKDDDGHALIRYHYQTKARSVLFRHATAEIVDVNLGYAGKSLQSVSFYEDGLLRHHYFNQPEQVAAQRLTAQFPDFGWSIVGGDDDDDRLIVLLESSTEPGRVIAYDRATNNSRDLFSVMPWLEAAALAPSIAATVRSGELDIEYYLTKPTGRGKYPLVVYPHGGPYGVRDYRLFDPFVQYLAQRGMAVLQVNYRGSSGFNEAFSEAGRGSFGTLMLDDIEAATHAVLRDVDTLDSSRVCVIGASYGGYAAMMLAIRSPELYRCAASHAGVADLGLLIGSYREDVGQELLSRFIEGGEAGYRAQYGQLRELSPVYIADQLSVPLLLTHGREDRVVDIEHFLRMKLRLEALAKPFEWQSWDDWGHDFSTPEDLEEFATRVAGFLEQNLAVPSRAAP